MEEVPAESIPETPAEEAVPEVAPIPETEAITPEEPVKEVPAEDIPEVPVEEELPEVAPVPETEEVQPEQTDNGSEEI